MKSPLPLAALLYALGIVLGNACPASLPCLFAASCAAALLALACGKLRKFALALLLPLAAWTNFTSRTAIVSPQDLRLLLGRAPQYVSVRGQLCSPPVYHESQGNPRAAGRSTADLDVVALRKGELWQPGLGCVTISVPGRLGEACFTGQVLEVTGVIQPPKSPSAPGQFDYASYLRYRGIYYQLRVENAQECQIAPASGRQVQPGPPWCDQFNTWAQKVMAQGLLEEDEPLKLLWAMVLGSKTALTQEAAEPFMESGTLHIFAISGLHIALIAGILVQLLRVLRVSRAACGTFAIPVIWFYTLATGWQASAIRSTVMMTIVIAGWALKRPPHLLNSLAAAGLAINIWDPRQFFQAGFQLSFFVVLGLALIVPPLESVRRRIMQPDPLLPLEFRPRWKRWLDLPLRVLTTSFATSLAAWLGSMPLIAFYFYMITPGSLLANLVIVPLSSIALMSSLGSLLCGSWCSCLTELFNHGSWLWMRLMIDLSEWFASLPGAYFYVRAPAWPEFVFYYALLGSLLTGAWASPRWRSCILVAVGVFTTLRLSCWWQTRGEVLMSVLPIRAGVVYVDAPGHREDLLVDAGDPYSATTLLKPFLRSQGVNRISALLLSHADLAHVGGSEHILSRFAVGKVLAGSASSRSPAFRRLLPELEKRPWNRVQRGDTVCGWTVLHPAAEDRFAQAQNSAVVLRKSVNGTRILFLSDLGRLGQRKLLEREADLQADIVVAGLSNDEFLSDALLNAIRPRLLIVGSAEYPLASRPTRPLRERLARREIALVYTSEAGAALLTFRSHGWQLKTMDARRATSDGLAPYLPKSPRSVQSESSGPPNAEPEG